VLMLQSLGCLESCSLHVLTCDGLHDLLLKCLIEDHVCFKDWWMVASLCDE
jgi:hypothetical protein